MERLKGRVKTIFFAGLVVVVPIVITALALFYLFRFLDDFFGLFFKNLLGIKIYGLGILSEIILIFLVGIIATNVLGARILKYLQGLLNRLPIIKRIYPAIQQIVEAFSPSSESSFKKVVLVEYPQKGVFSLGFLTNEVSVDRGAAANRFCSVYIPTNNLYLGNVALIKIEEVFVTSLTVEEGLKIILSGGAAFPSTLKGPTENL